MMELYQQSEVIYSIIGWVTLGVSFAIFTTWIKPPPDGWTWVYVVFGVAFTLGPVIWIIGMQTGDWALAWFVFWAFAFTGGPMILCQAAKGYQDWLDAKVTKTVYKNTNGDRDNGR